MMKELKQLKMRVSSAEFSYYELSSEDNPEMFPNCTDVTSSTIYDTLILIPHSNIISFAGDCGRSKLHILHASNIYFVDKGEYLQLNIEFPAEESGFVEHDIVVRAHYNISETSC